MEKRLKLLLNLMWCKQDYFPLF